MLAVLDKPVWFTYSKRENNLENQFTYSTYTSYLNQHRLMGSRDISSGQGFLPPRPINPENLSTTMEWTEFSGKGVLMAFTIIFIAPTAMVEAGYGRSNPYCVGIIKMDEGPMISSFIHGFDVNHPESIKIGTPMQAVYINKGGAGDEQVILAFEPR